MRPLVSRRQSCSVGSWLGMEKGKQSQRITYRMDDGIGQLLDVGSSVLYVCDVNLFDRRCVYMPSKDNGKSKNGFRRMPRKDIRIRQSAWIEWCRAANPCRVRISTRCMLSGISVCGQIY